MGRESRWPEAAERLYASEPMASAGASWLSKEGMLIEMFTPEESESLGEDLELWSKMPGWFAVGQDADDALLCVESKTGRCALVEIDELCSKSAQELAPSFEAFARMGSWQG